MVTRPIGPTPESGNKMSEGKPHGDRSGPLTVRHVIAGSLLCMQVAYAGSMPCIWVGAVRDYAVDPEWSTHGHRA